MKPIHYALLLAAVLLALFAWFKTEYAFAPVIVLCAVIVAAISDMDAKDDNMLYTQFSVAFLLVVMLCSCARGAEPAAEAFIKKHEGLRLEAYTDTTGHSTIGYGHKRLKGDPVKLTLADADFLFRRDITRAYEAARRSITNFDERPQHVRIAVLSMTFQLGPKGWDQFVKTIALINLGKYHAASVEILDSKWARQTPKRAAEVAKMLRGDS